MSISVKVLSQCLAVRAQTQLGRYLLPLHSLHAQVALHLLQHLLHVVVDLLGARLRRGFGPLRPLLRLPRLPLRLGCPSLRALLRAAPRLCPLPASLGTRAPSLAGTAEIVPMAKRPAWQTWN